MKPRALLLTSLMLLTLVRIADAKDPFEGTTWKVKVTPDDDAKGSGEKAFEDTLVFKGSKFVAEECKKKHGFEEADYDSDTRSSVVGTFTVTTKSETEGTQKWTGSVGAAEIKGDLVWTKKDGSVVNFSYTGEKKGS